MWRLNNWMYGYGSKSYPVETRQNSCELNMSASKLQPSIAFDSSASKILGDHLKPESVRPWGSAQWPDTGGSQRPARGSSINPHEIPMTSPWIFHMAFVNDHKITTLKPRLNIYGYIYIYILYYILLYYIILYIYGLYMVKFMPNVRDFLGAFPPFPLRSLRHDEAMDCVWEMGCTSGTDTKWRYHGQTIHWPEMLGYFGILTPMNHHSSEVFPYFCSETRRETRRYRKNILYTYIHICMYMYIQYNIIIYIYIHTYKYLGKYTHISHPKNHGKWVV